jgi:hypothetical protein
MQRGEVWQNAENPSQPHPAFLRGRHHGDAKGAFTAFSDGGKYVPSRLRLLPRSCLCNGLLEWRKSQGSKATIEQALVDVDVVAY